VFGLACVKVQRLSIAVFVLVLLVAPMNLAHAESVGQWTSTTEYPLSLAGESCVAVPTSVYCIGGFGGGGDSHDQVYFATLSASGVGSWSAGAPYPTAVDSASCVNATAGIYCVGGEDYPNNLNDVYFAPLSSSGLGAWSSVAAYPNALAGTSCVVYSGYIYCVGGFDSNGDEVSSTYYASLSSGLTSWTGTTQYPLAVDRESCVVDAGDIYCVAGETAVGSNQNSPITDAYYAPLSPSGIGQWTAALSYPTALAALSCAPYSGYVYCVGGFDSNLLSSTNAYFGQTSPSGVGSWTDVTQYPVPVDTGSCVAALGYLYCFAGNSVTQKSQSTLNPISPSYYAPISAAVTSTSTTPEFPVTVAIPVILALGLLVAAGLGRLNPKKIGPQV
jgi:Kelch motif